MTWINLQGPLSGQLISESRMLETSSMILLPRINPTGAFSSLSLEELGTASLLERQETKYLLPMNRLEILLNGLEVEYRILEIQGRRSFDYRSVYFDTPGRLFYKQHQTGALPRWKIRQRIYLNSGMIYFEVKTKDNRGITRKNRQPIHGPIKQINDETRRFLEVYYPGRTDALIPVLETRYSRITLARVAGGERITLDHQLRFSQGAHSQSLPDLVVAEVKQSRLNPRSPFMSQLKQIGVRPGSFSKYCIGSTLLDPTLKHNRFKPTLLQIATLGGRGKHHEWTH